MNLLALLVHLVAVVCYSITIYYDYHYINIPNREKYGGRWKFLTYWNLMMQFGYSVFCVINDLFGSDACIRKERSKLQVLRDDLFNALIFPASSFVAITFWSLYLIDRELIFPKALDPLFPMWANHAMHTSVLMWLLIDLLISNHLKSCHKKSLVICAAFCTAYLFLINLIWYKFDFWVYPILNVLSWPMKVAFMLSCHLSFFLFYFGCNFLTTSITQEKFSKKGKKRQ